MTRVEVLGPLVIRLRGPDDDLELLPLPKLTRAQLLLAILALEPRQHSRRELIKILWRPDDWDAVWEGRNDPDEIQEAANRKLIRKYSKSLDTAASAARLSLGAAAVALVPAKGQGLRLKRLANLEVDADEADRELRSRVDPERLAGLRRIRGPILQGTEDPWLEHHRDIQLRRIETTVEGLLPPHMRVRVRELALKIYMHGDTSELEALLQPLLLDAPPREELQPEGERSDASTAGNLVVRLPDSVPGRLKVALDRRRDDGAVPSKHIPLSVSDRARLGRLFTASAILLLADSFPDGAWARTLWRHGGKRFTEDFGDPEAIQGAREKRAISVSSWAGLALLKILGEEIAPLLAATCDYMMRFYDDGAGCFGFVHSQTSGTPLIHPSADFLPNPRHTASAVKFMYQLERSPRVIAKGVHFLLRAQTDVGSWGESVTDPVGNTLTTAYVLDALLLTAQDLRFVEEVLDHDEYRFVVSRYESTVYSGLEWLARQQSPDDGSWGYRPPARDPYPETRPYYTAHIICFLPQLLVDRDAVRQRVAGYLETMVAEGGLPEASGGPPAIAPTAMMVYGLYRVGDPQLASLVADGLKFLAGRVRGSIPPMHVFETTFSLLLGQYDDICPEGWQEDALEAIKSHLTIRSAPDSDADALIEGTLAACRESMSSLREPLANVLMGAA